MVAKSHDHDLCFPPGGHMKDGVQVQHIHALGKKHRYSYR